MTRSPLASPCLGAILAAVATACGGGRAGPPPVLVVGVDGAEWTVIERLAALGYIE
jgi:hypothetical protein